MSVIYVICKYTIETVDLNFLKSADHSYLAKIVEISHNKCSQTDIAHYSLNRSHPEQHTETNW